MSGFRTKLQEGDLLFSFVSALCAGVLLGSAFFVGVLWFMSIAGVALFLIVCTHARRRRHAFVYGWIAGFVFYGLLFGGVVANIFPFNWYGISHPLLQCIAVWATWFSISFVLGSVWGFVGLGVRHFRTGSLLDVLIFSSLWVLGECVSSFVYYLYTLGPGSFFGLHFTFGYLGYKAAGDYALLQLAAFGGVYVLSFVLVLCAALLVAAYEGDRASARAISICVLAWIVAHSLLMVVQSDLRYENPTLSVAVVSRYFPPGSHDTETETQEYEALLALVAPLRKLDVLVFPENATFTRTLFKEEHADDYERVVATGRTSRGPIIVDSQDSLQDNEFSSQVTLADTVDRSFGEKQFLMPFGEYIPFVHQFVVSVFGGSEVILEAVRARNYVPGDEVALHRTGAVVLALRFCDEVMSPFLYYEQVRQGANVLINISSYSWFQGSSFMYEHMKHIAQVRAVESGRWYVQSGNMSPAFVLNERGELVAQTNGKQLEVVTVEVEALTQNTFYVRTGVWIHLVLYISILGVCLGIHHKRKRV